MTVAEMLGAGLTCVIQRRGETVYKSARPGIAPLLDVIESGADVAGGVAYDKIVGKAAALLYAYMGVAEVNAEVMSEGGRAALERHGIVYTARTIAPTIINRRGDGPCPMELAAADIDEPAEAVIGLRARLADMGVGQ